LGTSATAVSASLKVAVAIPDTAMCSGRWSSGLSAVGSTTEDDFRLPRIAAVAAVGVDNDDGGPVAAGSLTRPTRT